MIKMILAMDSLGAIGKGNTLPWHCTEDMAHFIKYTKGKSVVMGRKTWESIGSKPLPNRTNYVLSKDPDYVAKGATTVCDLDVLIGEFKSSGDDLVIMGGGVLYNMALSKVDEIMVTVLNIEVESPDTYWHPGIKLAHDFTSKQIAEGTSDDIEYYIIQYNRIA